MQLHFCHVLCSGLRLMRGCCSSSLCCLLAHLFQWQLCTPTASEPVPPYALCTWRLLLQVTPLVIDDSLVAMCEIVADVRGWTMQQTAQQLGDNFKAFYQDQV